MELYVGSTILDAILNNDLSNVELKDYATQLMNDISLVEYNEFLHHLIFDFDINILRNTDFESQKEIHMKAFDAGLAFLEPFLTDEK